MSKRILTVALALCMAFTFFTANPVVASASALPAPEYAEIIDFVEYCAKHGLSYATQEEAKVVAIGDAYSKYKAMGSAGKDAVARTVGGGALTSLKTLGWAVTTTAITEYSVLTMGRLLLDNLEDLDDDLTQYICSVVSNCESDASYYATHVNLLEARFISGFDNLLSVTAGNEWAINSGLVEKTGFDASLLGKIGDSTAEFIDSDLSDFYVISYSIGVTSYMQYIPPIADSVYVSYDGTKTYVCEGNRLLNGYSSTSDVGYIMAYSDVTELWGSLTKAYQYSLPFDLSGCGYGGLKLYRLAEGATAPNTIGTVAVNAVEIVETYTVPMEEPETKSQVPSSVAVPTEDVESVLNDEKDIADYTTESTQDTSTDTAGFWSKLWEFLQKIVDAIASVPANFLQVIKDALAWLFVPSAGFTDEWVTEQMAFIDTQTGVLTYPFAVVLKFLNRLMEMDASDMVLTIPEVSWMNHPIIPETSFNMTEFLEDNDALSSFMDYYYIAIKGVLIFAVLNLARRKFAEMEMN